MLVLKVPKHVQLVGYVKTLVSLQEQIFKNAHKDITAPVVRLH